MFWERAKVILGNYNNNERRMLLVMFASYFLLVFTKDNPFRIYIAAGIWIVAGVYIYALIYRATQLKRDLGILDNIEAAEIGQRSFQRFLRMNSLLIVFPWLAMLVSSISIYDKNGVAFFFYSFFFSAIGLTSSLLYFFILLFLTLRNSRK